MLDDPNKKNNDAFPQGVRCQKCLQYGHWSYQCTNKTGVRETGDLHATDAEKK